MKKLLTLAALLATASMSFGQGYVSFANSTTTRISTNGVANANAGGAVGSWYYALFRTGSANSTSPSTSIDPLSAGWTLVAVATNAGLAGTFTGNTSSDGVVATPTAPSTDDYVVAGWSSTIGSSWAQVEAFFGNNQNMTQANVTGNSTSSASGASTFWFGIAPSFADNVIAQPSGTPINGLFGTTAGLIHGFSLQPFTTIPEPTSAALLGLGTAALMIFRRRK